MKRYCGPAKETVGCHGGITIVSPRRPAASLKAARLLHWTGKRKPWLADGMYVSLWRRYVHALCRGGGRGAALQAFPASGAECRDQALKRGTRTVLNRKQCAVGCI